MIRPWSVIPYREEDAGADNAFAVGAQVEQTRLRFGLQQSLQQSVITGRCQFGAAS